MKKINFELIDLEAEPYEVLAKMRRHHDELADANIALAWQKNVKPDKDGHLVLGKCIKATDLQKEFMIYDFVILLNQMVWEDLEFTMDQKSALMDHELCHAAPSEDDEGAQKCDERQRRVWRTRKHDIEEFQAVVARHGCYKRDLERFAEALAKKRKTPLFNTPSKEIDGARLQ